MSEEFVKEAKFLRDNVTVKLSFYDGSSVKLDQFAEVYVQKESKQMRCKIFQSASRLELEKAVNAWLSEFPVEVARTEFSMCVVDVGSGYRLEMTLVVFYVPMLTIVA